MLQLLDGYDRSAAAQRRLLAGLEQQHQAVLSSRGGGDITQVERVEADVSRDARRCVRFNCLGEATIYAAGAALHAGRFSTPRLGELSAWAAEARAAGHAPPARLRLFVFDGAGPLTDIGALQAFAPPRTLFQVASQFNCLESPGAFVTSVADYLNDSTQGPRAAISAFPGALVRHYAAPGAPGAPGAEDRFEQRTDGPQINLLADVCGDAARVHSGYLRAESIADPAAFAAALVQRLSDVRVGLHDDIQVVLGCDWAGAVAPGQRAAQVLTSTVAAGMYGALGQGEAHLSTICQQLQRAAYLGTLLSAAALGKDRAVLTLIGGGVFGNPLPVIWAAIRWALDAVEPLLHRDLTVVVNGRNLGQEVPAAELRGAAGGRGGALLRFDRSGGVAIED